ncbi:tyrosine-type recombinase/integrase [Achromobacter xylosoxidans]|uniref:tyrosine-type recombinase/integrase n=1 Tax=Alcaligenes xylosoxydans xylosoxydans TaxID=85698 RepID=UPI0009EC5986|nr:site-specific integrase [Achromobacter xylosoxidans]MCH1989816.1 tyrosine-type recombinase/integrase [Achromobacter xylosoxidans]MCH1992134.1 tyrosine-type recombinase/integrase [Achromobacter xylosoxidans]MCH4586291.1 tyrosine-type recombinase/integrase [Achromobacter xylosoxidans]
MATNLLTDTALRNARPGLKEIELNDGGGLIHRIRPDGRRAWIFRYTGPTSGKRERIYLGAYPNLSLKMAREMRQARQELILRGMDPKNAAALLDDDGEAIPETVGRLFNVWFTQEIEANRKRANDHQSIKGRYHIYAAPFLADLALAVVRRGHVMKAIDKARLEKKMRTANLVLANLRQMFRFAVAREWMQGDPTAAITRKQAGGQDNEGERVLSDEELPMLRDALARPPEQKSRYYQATRRVLPVHTELMVWWTLATAARPIEVASIRRAGAVNVKARTWTIPADVSKNGKPHVVHLSDFALTVWDRMLGLPSGKGDFLIPGKDGGHISEKEVTRRLTDRQTRAKPVRGRKNSTDLDLPGGHWTQHDVRRTAATIMGELGFTQDVIDRCLNHTEPKKVTRTYQRQVMLQHRRAAFEALGKHLTALLGDPADWLPSALPPPVARVSS